MRFVTKNSYSCDFQLKVLEAAATATVLFVLSLKFLSSNWVESSDIFPANHSVVHMEFLVSTTRTCIESMKM
jgi:hypothetical protein